MSSQFSLADYDEAADCIRSRSAYRPALGLVLGSGLGSVADQIEAPDAILYDSIPHFPTSTVPGHVGRLVLGCLAGVTVCVMQGRFHYYEGYSMAQTTFPIRVMGRLGVHTLILTNAAGGINPSFQVGDVMVIDDHLNLPGMMGQNPFIGPNLSELGPRFPPMNPAYSRHLIRLVTRAAGDQGIALRSGVYAYVTGPAFETAAEVRALRLLGADAVGMSTVPEALVAKQGGMQILGISTITNLAADKVDDWGGPSHEEVLDRGSQMAPGLSRLLIGFLSYFGQLDGELSLS